MIRSCRYLSLLLVFALLACQPKEKKEKVIKVTPTDLPAIKKKEALTVVTLYSSTSYFQYKMKDMGYEYDMVSDFANSMGLRLDLKVAHNATQMEEMLLNNKVDLVAYPVHINKKRKNVIFCGKTKQSYQVLVQRKQKGKPLLTDVTELIDKEVSVRKGSRYAQRIHNLNNEMGGGIRINTLDQDTLTNEDLIAMVSDGEIDYTVSDENTAQLNRTYYWNIRSDLKLSFPQRSSWMVRKDCPMLASAIDIWANKTKSKPVFRAITKRYFELSKQPFQVRLSKVKDGHISPYDSIFKAHALVLGWDWQILASIAYQESHFQPQISSWAGAEGLMGIMPNTAMALGASPNELRDPTISIRLSVECLRRFRQGFSEISNEKNLICFTLASYNAGIGHIYDAQRLTKKYGKDPLIWEKNVAEYVRRMSEPFYYNDSVCKYGYVRGSETYAYVREVMERSAYYKKETK